MACVLATLRLCVRFFHRPLVDARGNVVGIVAAKLDASAALAATGSLPENVNYAVKSSLLLSFLESVPEVAS